MKTQVPVLLVTLVILLVNCVGCSTSSNQPKPIDAAIIHAAETVSKREYKLNVYDCSNMAVDLALKLVNKGYDARLYLYQPSYSSSGHAIVEVHLKDGRVIYLDATCGPEEWLVQKPLEAPQLVYTIMQVRWLQQEGYKEYILNELLGHLKENHE